ncbi:MAG: hypothetical protein O3A47_08070 [Chloroflexi bacterium]|nr:hypothetical protein [Chloroflexota bacterium]
MSGDEDVREGVAEAQERGVSVVLMGVEAPPGRANQAATLVREADDLIVLSRPDCSKFLARRQVGKAVLDPLGTITVDVEECGTPRDFGRAHGAAFREQREPSDVAPILVDHPSLPRHLDGWLLTTAAGRFGSPLEESTRRDIRAGFWEGLQTTSPDFGTGEDVNPDPLPQVVETDSAP